jgi:hypothetical protein
MFCDELPDFLGNEGDILNRMCFANEINFRIYFYVNKRGVPC